MIEQKNPTSSPSRSGPEYLLIRKWLRTALCFFLVASLLGALMRFMFVLEIPFLKYKHVLHAHSHTAMLGWGFMLLTAGMMYCLPGLLSLKNHRLIYRLNTIAVSGMIVSFLWQGYGTISILFATLHIITMYIFAFLFLKAINKQGSSESKVFFKWGVIWMAISSLGIWSLGITSALLGKLHPLFYASVQFFLHFQFNGWFTYVAIGLLIHYLNRSQPRVKIPGNVFALIQLSLLLTYTLSITWSNPLEILFHVNALGVILQLVAYGLVLIAIFEALFSGDNPWKTWSDRLILAGLFSLLFKILIQALVVWPSVAVISYTIRNYVIAFIHLIMLGSITCAIGGILLKEQVLPWNRITKAGWILLLAGFLLTEFVLFGQGTMLWMGQGFIPGYYIILLAFTLFIPSGIIFILNGSRTSGKKQSQ